MPSLIQGYEYDIFISYRHKDNKYDGWVADFVANLKKELEATFKEEISIYFDANPHDGLLEMHHVDKSLEGKLRCLLFIPIISQTYCDTKSFAWEHEFCAFNKMAKSDAIGRDIKLKNGNVGSRILPIRIHELDAEDKVVLEHELGGVLRSVEFIYKSAGVNRPLRAVEDHPQDNLNKTFYRDQINKVANAIKEIVSVIRKPDSYAGNSRLSKPVSLTRQLATPVQKRRITRVAVGIIALILLSFLLYRYTPWNIKPADKTTDKSIAVLPFINMSDDPEQKYFSDGMMEEILNQLTKIRDLKVTSRTSSVLYRDSKLPLREIAKELGVAHVVEGSVRKAGNNVRITIQLIEANSDKHLLSETYDRSLSDIFSIQTEISTSIARQLNALLSREEEKQLKAIPTSSQEAYDYYLQGIDLFRNGNYKEASELYTKAIDLDPKFTLAYLARSHVFASMFFNKGDSWIGKDHLAWVDLEQATLLAPDLVDTKIRRAQVLYLTEKKYDKAIEILVPIQQSYSNNAEIMQVLGRIQRRKGQWKEALRNMESALLIDPANTEYYYETARLHLVLRNYDKALEYVEKAGESVKFLKLEILPASNPNTAEVIKAMEGDKDYDVNRYFLLRDFPHYLAEVDKMPDEIFQGSFTYAPTTLFKAEANYFSGNVSNCKKFAGLTIDVLNKALEESPDDFRIYSSLGQAYGYAGKYDAAIAAAIRSTELMPLSKDAFVDGVRMQETLAYVYILCEKYDLAMDKIEYLLTIPGYLSVPYLKNEPYYDKLRNLPRFKKILATEYKTKY